MQYIKRCRTVLAIIFVWSVVGNAMEQPGPSQMAAAAAGGQAGYDSDSEDERDYQYHGLPHLRLSQRQGTRCLAVSRGIHFSSTSFDKPQRSHMRRADESGWPIYASAAYDMAGVPLGSQTDLDRVQAMAMRIREMIAGLPPEKRNEFQELYSNSYDAFHKKLGKPDPKGIFAQFTSQKNPQVSTSETFLHGARYAAGMKYLGAGIEKLDPEYDGRGKPRHPYLGKLYIMLVDEARTRELEPYFVVWAHANAYIKISEHYSKNVLVEREVSFPGLIPGECVVLSTPVRVPSFAGEYKTWYADKYGISKRVFTP